MQPLFLQVKRHLRQVSGFNSGPWGRRISSGTNYSTVADNLYHTLRRSVPPGLTNSITVSWTTTTMEPHNPFPYADCTGRGGGRGAFTSSPSGAPIDGSPFCFTSVRPLSSYPTPFHRAKAASLSFLSTRRFLLTATRGPGPSDGAASRRACGRRTVASGAALVVSLRKTGERRREGF